MLNGENKVWAMYDGDNCPDYITRGKWYEVEDDLRGGFSLVDDVGESIFSFWENCEHIGGDSWQRHVGPTPPAPKDESPVAVVDDATQEAQGWITHDGSANRPNGVGKRDEALAEWIIAGDRFMGKAVAKKVNWSCVARYRVTKRAPVKEERRKVWLQGGEGLALNVCEGKAHAFEQKAKWGGQVFTAKLRPVRDTDK